MNLDFDVINQDTNLGGRSMIDLMTETLDQNKVLIYSPRVKSGLDFHYKNAGTIGVFSRYQQILDADSIIQMVCRNRENTRIDLILRQPI